MFLIKLLIVVACLAVTFFAGFVTARISEREIWCYDPVWQETSDIGVRIATCERDVQVHWID